MIAIASHIVPDDGGNLDQAANALGVAEAIIQLLEFIDVAHKDGGARRALFAAAPNVVKRFNHPPPVGDAGEWISPGEIRQPLVRLG